MNSRIIRVALAIALILIVGVVTAYILQFGVVPASEQGTWGQFGDYFAGLLNPLFAMLAFLALIWSISIQREELRRASEHLSEQTSLARKQLDELASDRLAQELLHVIKEIDARLDQVTRTVVSPEGSEPSLTVSLLVAEGERLRASGGHSAAYHQFVRLSQEKGTVVEAVVREMTHLVAEMQDVLAQFSQVRGSSYAPLIVYYANKVYRLLTPLEDVHAITCTVREFYATVSDKHH
ncbi:hypothetical protein SAMN05421829_1105 [Aromatoleum tolulyticum]|uniref:Uncharacterized protein n=1 Tax=Aromatoleum tolulyticum TaxID=34027 RepID=A0A1N6YAH3_9RHOO|nr:hypothetical protein [Aromatoleum tolulyticum]SIR11574.1 hypothetical protein SAMN05421829_1105 [Aromatoleum tolulyticum]